MNSARSIHHGLFLSLSLTLALACNSDELLDPPGESAAGSASASVSAGASASESDASSGGSGSDAGGSAGESASSSASGTSGANASDSATSGASDSATSGASDSATDTGGDATDAAATTDTAADTDSGGLTCLPDQGESACVVCTKSACCAEYDACLANEECACLMECLFQEGATLVECQLACDALNPIADLDLLFQCDEIALCEGQCAALGELLP